MINEKRKRVEELLSKWIIPKVTFSWCEGMYGNQIIKIYFQEGQWNITAIGVEIDRMLFIDNTIQANVDYILYYVRKHIIAQYINERTTYEN